ncbi:hypothetical protein AKJ66_00590 [candidate division MSBL1 archaeon SCGC-AAA259E22]|uniref:DUF2070 domain-containing protein n=1 Tax=candidate division MSBL1 archaeon SCGC-AAA259E22 TaxID=1698265 RepID=A0A133UI38_9EURY|nr:hypothetical protein AKJ66_00590 [candidate division MSBL1 archaeon SCGC-AAA259E22]
MKGAEKFKGILFSSPSPNHSLITIFAIGLVFGFFCSTIGIMDFHKNFLISSLGFSLIFILPAVFYGGLTSYLIRYYYRRRALLLALLNEVLVFIGLLFFKFFEPMLLFFLGFAYSINVLSIAGISNRKGPTPLLFPLLYFIPILSGLYLGNVFILTIFKVTAFFGIGVASLSLVYFVDYLFQMNLQVSASQLFTYFLNEKPKNLGFGTEKNVLLQGLKFKTGKETYILSLPWLHPGPSRQLGGGSLSYSLIKNLNEKGNKGYFWHVPSSHEEDPCDPRIFEKIIEKPQFENSAFEGKATKLLKRDNDSFEIYGQRFGDIYLIFSNVEKIDDFEISIFQKIREQTGKKIVFVDMHHHEPPETGKILLKNEKLTDELSRTVLDLLKDLENEGQFEVKIGMEVSRDNKFMVLVEELNNERYLLITMDRNGIPEKLNDELENIKRDNRFDKFLFLTTDTHENFNFLDAKKEIEFPSSELITKALKKTSKAEISLTEHEIENVRVLGKKSYIFETASLFAMYLFPALMLLVFLIFFLIII